MTRLRVVAVAARLRRRRVTRDDERLRQLTRQHVDLLAQLRADLDDCWATLDDLEQAAALQTGEDRP